MELSNSGGKFTRSVGFNDWMAGAGVTEKWDLVTFCTYHQMRSVIIYILAGESGVPLFYATRLHLY